MSVDLAFIGAGGIANRHFDRLEDMDAADVVAICDIDADAARDAADRFDARAFTDHHDLYDDADFDAVFVCLPPFAHTDQELLAVENGVDLFVEKPLGLSYDYAAEVRDAIQASDVVAQVGYNWRYSRGVERAREILDGRDVGYVDGYWWGGVPGGLDHWWREFDRSGGQVVEQATHVYDTVRYLGGDVERVSAAGGNRVVDIVDFSDVTSATMTHENDVVSHVSSTSALDHGEKGVDVIAEGARLDVGQKHLAGVVDGEAVDETFDYDPYRAEVEAFLDAVETRDAASVRAPYADALETFELTLAVNEAIETGDQIDL